MGDPFQCGGCRHWFEAYEDLERHVNDGCPQRPPVLPPQDAWSLRVPDGPDAFERALTAFYEADGSTVEAMVALACEPPTSFINKIRLAMAVRGWPLRDLNGAVWPLPVERAFAEEARRLRDSCPACRGTGKIHIFRERGDDGPATAMCGECAYLREDGWQPPNPPPPRQTL